MLVCPSCGEENPERFRLCGMCGAPLAADAPPAREERKVVTVLFADLVGFTTRAERLDPEDVRALLSSYHARVRAELERHGGTVEKFIGDAVMALFGAPTAHEDDPERALRSALAIREAIAELNEAEPSRELHVRIGITTGEALVALGARPHEGEGMASGDVVNTAARLQAAAPVDGILVDETTFRATRDVIEYGESFAVEAKGKADRVEVREALQARARFGVDVTQAPRAPLVGRRPELEALIGALTRARRERQPQLVTLVGVPGIGKSRLVYELFGAVDRDPELIDWRQGRSLPYGEGVSFWALGEMVKAHAGILETDPDEAAQTKLARVVQALDLDETERRWIESHLRPLVGGETGAGLGGDRRCEAFAAWRRFLELVAESGPLVLVFEDLHWADEGLLDFVDHLVDWATGVPLLVVATARPELLARRPGWGGGKPNAATLSLSPLSDEETARLVHSLLERPVLPADLQAGLLERAGGNPLYAEEFVRLASERPGEIALPESVQGIIAARLDALRPEEKELLQDGAVLGKVFWLGALAGERWTLAERLHALERKEFVRRERRSSVAGETEYAFRHALVRDVAYEQLPRRRRAEKHRTAAHWLESLGRREDHAEMLAHHYVSAIALMRAGGEDVSALGEPARLALRDAGDRALRLNALPAAAHFYAQALELWPDDGERPPILFRYAQVLHSQGDERAERVLCEARDALLAADDVSRAAEAEAYLAYVWWERGQRDRCFEHLDRALQLVGTAERSPAKAAVLTEVARFRMLAGENEEALRVGREALELAEELGLDEARAHTLITLGVVESWTDRSFESAERGLALARSLNASHAVARGYNVLASLLAHAGDLARALELLGEAERELTRLGNIPGSRFARGNRIHYLYDSGDWDVALRLADEFIAECEGGAPHYLEPGIRLIRGSIGLARGDADGVADVERALELSRQAKDPQVVTPTLATTARLYVDVGRVDEAGALVDELCSLADMLPDARAEAGLIADRVGRHDDVKKRLARGDGTPLDIAACAAVDGDFARAADVLADMGARTLEAYARLRAADALIATGRRREGEQQLQRALAFYRSVGATRYVREGESLLAASA